LLLFQTDTIAVNTKIRIIHTIQELPIQGIQKEKNKKGKMNVSQKGKIVFLFVCISITVLSCRILVLPSRDKNDSLDKMNNAYPSDSIRLDEKEIK
jgi:hypothetical protein